MISSRQLLRSPKDNGAEIVLADGSVVEIAPRSELDLVGSRRGTTVRLRRGNIIVRAAEQHGGRLFVATDDCRVAVKGTVFAVDHGFKGSRVSVIQGEVEVRSAGRTDVLAPGEQITTNDRLRAVSIEEQIAWSPNSQRARRPPPGAHHPAARLDRRHRTAGASDLVATVGCGAR